MKEYKCFASPKDIALRVILFSVILLFEGIFFFFNDESNSLPEILFFLISSLFIAVPLYCFGKNSFSRTYISKEGIRNKHISFRWDEITAYHICELDRRTEIIKHIKYPLIVCVGDVRSKYFVFCDMRKTVAFSLTKKNLKVIEKLCEDKNETIAELLTWVHFPMEH